MRLRIQWLNVEFDATWEVRPPWDDNSIRELHGAYLTHRPSGSQLHLCGWPAASAPELEAMLLEQNWGSPPRDRVARRVGATAIVGGTFPYLHHAGAYVREWFLSDGEHGANSALLFSEDTPLCAVAACEALLDTIQWAL